jgi:long-chain acyl-CoA synthetase
MDPIWLNHYPKETSKEINISQFSSVLDVLAEAVTNYSQKPAFSCMGKTITFGQLESMSNDFASYLQNHTNLKVGDRIAIQMPNLLQFPVALFGAIKAGLIIVNTNPLYTAREMQHQFKDSGAKAIVIVENFASHLDEIIKNTSIETVILTQLGDSLGFPKSLIVNSVVKYVKKMVPAHNLKNFVWFNDALSKGKGKLPAVYKAKNEDLAFLQYTGGTTGVSKGAMLTHGNILANMEQIVQWMLPRLKKGEETIVTALPLYHIFSLTVNCMAFFRFGAHNILITNPRDIPGFIKILRTTHFTVMTGVNTLFNALMNHPDFGMIDFSKVRVSVAGAMALQKVVAEKWTNLTKSLIVEGYGLTESSPVVCCNPINGTERVGTIGLPLPSTNVKLIDDNEKEIKLGEAGELCVKGPQVMKGYWNQPEETKKIMTADGWLKTGDVAQVDKDGYFKIVDRKKDMILVSGFNVYPNEVEDVVATMAGVLECAAVGVPDEKSGELVKIVIVKKEASLTEAAVIEHCKKLLTAYKVPKIVEFRTELPKTNVGKILRRALRG